MNFKYQVHVLEMKEVHEIPNAWTNDDYKNLLNNVEYEDVDSIACEELKEMTAMALSDVALEEAVEQTLLVRLGDKLTKGQRHNLVQELQDERLWEEYSEIDMHEELFNVSTMLYMAYPKKFPEPDIVRITINIKALNTPSAINIKEPKASFLARLLTDGMDDHNIIYRLFDEQLASNSFPEAEHIIWQADINEFDEENQSTTITIHTSWNWVDELKGVKEYESKAYADGQLK